MSTTMSPLRVDIVTGTISSLNLPAFWAASALFCEPTAKRSCYSRLICHFGGDVLRGVAHVISVEGVDQSVLQHGVEHLHLAHFDPAAQIRGVGGERHRFLPAGDDDVRVAVGDLLQSERDRTQTAAAQLIEAEGGFFLRNTGLHRRLASGILALRALKIWPRITSSTSAGSTFAASRAALMATAPRSCAGVEPKTPLNEPTGVLFALAMTISEADMTISLSSTVGVDALIECLLHDPLRTRANSIYALQRPGAPNRAIGRI